MKLDGRIEDFDLFEVVQAALRHSQPSRLLVADDDREGMVHIQGGFVVDATQGGGSGEDALFQILAWRQGLFSLTGAEATDGGRIHWSWAQLQREAFRRAAQAAATEIEPLDEDQIAFLGRDLAVLVGNLEAETERLAEEPEPLALLETLCKMLNMAVSLVPLQAKRLEFQLDDVLPRHGWRPGASFVQIQDGLVDCRSLAAIYEAAAFDPASRAFEVRTTIHTLTAALGDVLHQLTELATGRSGHPELVHRGQALLNELSASARRCRF